MDRCAGASTATASTPIAEHRGDFEEALWHGREGLRLCSAVGRRRSMAAWSVGELAGPEAGLGRPERAARLQGASDAALERMGAARGPGDQPEYERVRRGLVEVLGPERLEGLRREGAGLHLADAVRYALGEWDPFDPVPA